MKQNKNHFQRQHSALQYNVSIYGKKNKLFCLILILPRGGVCLFFLSPQNKKESDLGKPAR